MGGWGGGGFEPELTGKAELRTRGFLVVGEACHKLYPDLIAPETVELNLSETTSRRMRLVRH